MHAVSEALVDYLRTEHHIAVDKNYWLNGDECIAVCLTIPIANYRHLLQIVIDYSLLRLLFFGLNPDDCWEKTFELADPAGFERAVYLILKTVYASKKIYGYDQFVGESLITIRDC